MVIGGGVAGLCAALRLAELGKKPLLIEGGKIPSQKICGEFFSSESWPLLRRLMVEPASISKVNLHSVKQTASLHLSSPAAAISHKTFDVTLANLVQSFAGEIKSETYVEKLQPKTSEKQNHLIYLTNGEVVEAKTLLIATGRLPGLLQKPPCTPYLGFKAHFKELPVDPCLTIYLLPKTYLGIVPIEKGFFNVAGLAKIDTSDPKASIKKIIQSHPDLQKILDQTRCCFSEWLYTKVPEFGFKETPNWLDAYFIGDAALTIPPASGSGLSLAITSGKLAAEYSVKELCQEFKQMWKKRGQKQLFWAKVLHHMMLNPFHSSFLKFINFCPLAGQQLYRLTRQTFTSSKI